MSQTKEEHQTLTEIWEKKLEAEGLGDIENKNGQLHNWHSFMFRNTNQITREVTEFYYEKAQDLYNNFEFANWEHREIWNLHCQGLSVREIAEEFPKFEKSWIHRIVKMIRKEINWKRGSF
jgi:hypothetical protein